MAGKGDGRRGKVSRMKRETKIKQKVGGFHGLLTAERNSKRGYPPAGTR